MNRHTILFLAANPLGTDRLALDQEARAIHTELERSGRRDRFALVTRWAAQPLDLLRELRKLRPSVVHFSGRGGSAAHHQQRSWELYGASGLPDGDHRDGLFFQRLDGRPQLVSTAAIEETFGAAGASVRLVVLNACYSEMQAEALLAHVGCIVCISGSIRDDAAKNFAIGFYGGIAECESIAGAYKQGRAAISLEGLPDGERLQLKVRNGLDAEDLLLAEVPPETTTDTAPLRFASIAIDANDKNWHIDSHYPDSLERYLKKRLDEETRRFCESMLTNWPFKRSAHLHLANDHKNSGDPLFDITVMNTTDTPIIVTAIGIEIQRVAYFPCHAAATPTATKIRKTDSYVLEIPDIKHLHFGDSEGPADVYELISKHLPDPIYLEPRAPYRYGVLLKRYSKHMPDLARIRITVSIDRGLCYSMEIEMSQGLRPYV